VTVLPGQSRGTLRTDLLPIIWKDFKRSPGRGHKFNREERI
jgi:hypothetical protein